MTDTPWYMRTTDTSNIDKGSPERARKHVESIANTASPEDEATIAHLTTAKASGVELNPGLRMARGYAKNARSAAAQLGALTRKQDRQPSSGNLSPEERIARGYGA